MSLVVSTSWYLKKLCYFNLLFLQSVYKRDSDHDECLMLGGKLALLTVSCFQKLICNDHNNDKTIHKWQNDTFHYRDGIPQPWEEHIKPVYWAIIQLQPRLISLTYINLPLWWCSPVFKSGFILHKIKLYIFQLYNRHWHYNSIDIDMHFTLTSRRQ